VAQPLIRAFVADLGDAIELPDPGSRERASRERDSLRIDYRCGD
jgi:hypothetical protein